MSKIAPLLLSFLVLAATASAATAQTIRIGSVTNARFGGNWTLDGGQMQNTRAKLLDAANFGPTGTVRRAITITDTAAAIGSVNATLLSQFDVFFIGYLEDGSDNAFTPAELTAMTTWVEGGGAMVITCDDSDYDAVCAHFGYPSFASGPSVNPILPTAAGATHPLFSGPFGLATAINMVGTRGAFTTTTGATVLAVDSTAGTPFPGVMVKSVGAGRIVLLADVDLIANGASGGPTITSPNDRFLGNVFAFAGGVPVNPPIRVGSVSTSRFPYGWTLDGGQMENTRAKLLNPATFGADGKVRRSIAITDTAAAVGSVSAALLSQFDVFFIGYLEDDNDNAFTPAELAAMTTWVEGGGTMIITCDDSDFDAVCAHFGYPADPGGPSNNPIVPTAAGAVHPLFSGPFGTVTAIEMNGTQGAFTTAAGATVLAVDSTSPTPYPGVLVKSVGAGRIILLADVDLIATGATQGPDIASPNDQFLANLFAFAAGISANYQGLFWNAPAGSQSGWGINFVHQGDTIFATWFTYDQNGKPWWIAAVLERKGPGVYSGDLFTATGPSFSAEPFNPALVTETVVGTATITFSDNDNGTFDYTVNGVSQSKNITRQLFASPVPTCVWGANPDLATATNFQALWWAKPPGSQAGWGINFTHQDDIIFATWFTYDFSGKPWWLAIEAHRTGPGVYTGNLFTTTGPPFNAVPFNPALVVETTVGTGTFTFTDGNNATFDYNVFSKVEQSKPITQQVYAEPGTICR